MQVSEHIACWRHFYTYITIWLSILRAVYRAFPNQYRCTNLLIAHTDHFYRVIHFNLSMCETVRCGTDLCVSHPLTRRRWLLWLASLVAQRRPAAHCTKHPYRASLGNLSNSSVRSPTCSHATSGIKINYNGRNGGELFPV